jgi:hypothetical protein
MLQHVRAGDHPSARQWNEMIDLLKASGITGPGTSNIGGRQQIVDRPDKQPAKFAFVVGINYVTGMIITRDATWIPDEGLGWMIASGAENAIEKPPGPGLTVEDFEPFVARNDPPQLTDPVIQLIDDACWLPSRGGGGAGVWFGKIVQANLHSQLAYIAPIKSGVDPSSELLWTDEYLLEPEDEVQSNFQIKNGRCCWIMGYTGYLKNQPVVVFEVSGSPFPWAVNAWNLTGPQFMAWCEPDGPFAPQRELDCAPPPESANCDEGACCRELVGTFSGQDLIYHECSMTTSAGCSYLSGDFWPGKTCRQSVDLEGNPVAGIIDQGLCDAIRPCCLPSGECRDTMKSECDALRGEYHPEEDVPCAGYDCAEPVLCCFPDGMCNETMEAACTAARGRVVDECVECERVVGCCVHYAPGTGQVFECLDNYSEVDCRRTAYCLANPNDCGHFDDDCSASADCR